MSSLLRVDRNSAADSNGFSQQTNAKQLSAASNKQSEFQRAMRSLSKASTMQMRLSKATRCECDLKRMRSQSLAKAASGRTKYRPKNERNAVQLENQRSGSKPSASRRERSGSNAVIKQVEQAESAEQACATCMRIKELRMRSNRRLPAEISEAACCK